MGTQGFLGFRAHTIAFTLIMTFAFAGFSESLQLSLLSPSPTEPLRCWGAAFVVALEEIPGVTRSGLSHSHHAAATGPAFHSMSTSGTLCHRAFAQSALAATPPRSV